MLSPSDSPVAPSPAPCALGGGGADDVSTLSMPNTPDVLPANTRNAATRVSNSSREATPDNGIGVIEPNILSDCADPEYDSHSASSVEHISKHECRKLVYAFSKELALFCHLSLGLGGTSDSDRLREELRRSRHRLCALAKQNKHTLIPLLKRKHAESDDTAELEKLYRVYSGCLEYLEIQLHKVSSLQAIFPLHTGQCFLINTGIAEPTIHRSSVFTIDRSLSRGSLPSPSLATQSREKDELDRIKGELEDIQQLLYHVSSTVDIKPWDVVETDHKLPDGLEVKKDERNNKPTRPIHGDSTRKRRVCLCVVGVVIALLVISVTVGVSVGVLSN